MREIYRTQREWMPRQWLGTGAYVGALGVATGIVGMTGAAFYLGEKVEAGAEALGEGGKAVRRFYQKYSRMPWRWLGTGIYVVALAIATVIVGAAAAVSFIREKAEAGTEAWQARRAARRQQVPQVVETPAGTYPAEVAAGARKVTATRVRVFSKRVAAAPEAEEAVKEAEETTRQR
ncbi:MAG: hypothetical protein KJ624_08455 [Chloroflexi bacterium]|nr:hypothetical protein [Chloroflexota bacterium]